MYSKTDDRKVKQRTIYLDDETYKLAQLGAKLCNRSISRYIASLIRLKLPKRVPPAEYHKIYINLSQIGNNINQIAKIANSNGSVDYAKLKNELKTVYEVRDILKDLALKPTDMTIDDEV